MMMSVHRLPQTFPRHVHKLMDDGGMNTGQVRLRWTPTQTPPQNYDPNVESSYRAPATPVELPVNALIYFISVRSTERQFAEFETGDVIVTFDADLRDADGNALKLADLPALTFVLPDEKEYVQRSVGKKPAEYWDAFIGGETFTRTLLLTASPQTRS